MPVFRLPVRCTRAYEGLCWTKPYLKICVSDISDENEETSIFVRLRGLAARKETNAGAATSNAPH